MKIHIDIDCFFVSALRTKDNSLIGKPVGIGGRTDTKIFDQSAKEQTVNFQNSGSFVPTFYKAYKQKDDDLVNFMDVDGKVRGILTTASYEARAFGVTTAMRITEALELCPELIIKAPNMSLFQELSHQLHQFLLLRIPLVEQASIDEFFGDLSGWVEPEDVESFCKALQQEILQTLALPVSIGAAKTKYIAKLTTSFAKPFGVKVVFPHQQMAFVKQIDIAAFPGIGKRTKEKLHQSGIYTLGELYERRDRLKALGSYAKGLYKKIFCFEDEPLRPYKERKSIGISRTIEPLYDRKELERRVIILARHLSFAIMQLDLYPTRYSLSLRYEMGKKSSLSITERTLFCEDFLYTLVCQLLQQVDTYKQLHIIRISLYCTNFTKTAKQELDITTFHIQKKKRHLSKLLSQTRQKYGLDIVKNARELL